MLFHRVFGFAVLIFQCCLLNLYSSQSNAFYEDNKCTCICPGVDDNKCFNSSVVNLPLIVKELVSAEDCTCERMVLPRFLGDAAGMESSICSRCVCTHEKRDTATILVVVLLVMWSVTVLTGYMLMMKYLMPSCGWKHEAFYQMGHFVQIPGRGAVDEALLNEEDFFLEENFVQIQRRIRRHRGRFQHLH